MQIQKINLDFSQNYYKDIVVKQNDKDSRSVVITVTDNGVKYPLDSSIHMCNVRMLTPDGRAIYNETTILSDGTVKIDFTDQMVFASGTGDLEIHIATSTQTISTMHLNVVIVGSVYPDGTIIASDEFNALTAALLKVQGGTGGEGGDEPVSVYNDIYAETSINLGRKEGTTVGTNSATIGVDNEASGMQSMAVGYGNTASGRSSIALGMNSKAIGMESISVGNGNTASGNYSIAGGQSSEATAWDSFAFGYSCKATEYAAIALGNQCVASGKKAFAMGDNAEASGNNSSSIGYYTKASGSNSFAQGDYCEASGESCHVEGHNNKCNTSYGHAEGDHNTIEMNATASHVEGYDNNIYTGAYYSHAEGYGTKVYGTYAHTEGYGTKAIGDGSHAEGDICEANGGYSHAQGYHSIANKYASHAEGYETIADCDYQHVQGKYNVADTEGIYAHIVGGGESNSERKNIHTLDWEGNAVFAGNVTDGNGDSIASVKALIQAGGTTDEQVQTAVESYLSENPIESGVDYSPTIKAVNHRGYSASAPENTLPAYILSKKKGFKYAECDVAFSSDGVAVLLHDDTIDRTSDGSGSISSLTYEQLLTYDFGSWFSSEYAGTKIPTFEEFIKLCKHIDLHPYIELKSSGNYTQEQITSIVNMVKAMGMKGRVTYISFNADFLGYVKTADSSARLGYLSNTSDDNVITTVISLRTGNNEVYAGVKYTTLTSDFISDCISANIPLEIWTINDIECIRNMNGYISGVTSDSLNAVDILCSEYINSVGSIGFPTNEDGTANYGTKGQFYISNGDGTTSWISLDVAEGGAF